eukprot:CCRYP_003766-RA/>CCRYP_003766-RA protein AED:0.39 eAED:0.43 QI:0/0/0/1/0/0/2/0/130
MAFYSPAVWVGHNSAGSGRSPKDDFIFLLSSPSSSLSSSSNENHGNTTKWKVRPPKPLSCTPQSMAVSPHGGRGRYVVFSCTDGNCYLYRWMDSNNLLRRQIHPCATWSEHSLPVTWIHVCKGSVGGVLN